VDRRTPQQQLLTEECGFFGDLYDAAKFCYDGISLLAYMKTGATTPDFWEQVCDANRHKLGLVFVGTGKQYTFGEMEERANKVAHWAKAEGLKKGDVVILLMESRPEYIFTWLGLSKLGIISAQINYNLKGKSLQETVLNANAKHMIFSSTLVDQVEAIGPVVRERAASLQWWCWTTEGCPSVEIAPSTKNFNHAFDAASAKRPAASERAGLLPTDCIFYIYTSGTTGLPKAVKINHARIYSAGIMFSKTFGVTPSDVVYCTLPLYHSAGGNIGIGLSWANGSPLILREKFSASKFWEDCAQYNVTVAQYIGELCRYLLAAPPHKQEASHKVRMAIGNGLRPDIWEGFQKRFNIKEIAEFYSATEATFGLFNNKNKVGAIGHYNWIVRKLIPLRLVKFDMDNEEPARDKSGFCQLCNPDEVGEAISQIFLGSTAPAYRFEGYTDKKASEKKILRDVFAKGDTYFRSGDLMKMDAEGFYYFVDRIGDTFRWKGENVATTEVAEAISGLPGVNGANVYGVEIPGMDGRAGMAAVVVGDDFNMEPVYNVLKTGLQAAAVPIFIRLQRDFTDMTGTMKFRKVDFQKDGFNPAAVTDELFFRDDKSKSYVPITPGLFDDINSGAIKF
jgi:fatty-acyl-CoA synthase